jgi:hypothetical protein
MREQIKDALDIAPQEVSKAIEGVLHVASGKYDKLPDLMRDAGSILMRASRKLTTTQIVLAVSVLAVGVIVVATAMNESHKHQHQLED